MIFVVTGPSGAGKTTLVRKVLDDFREITFSVSHTTRPRRAAEEEGRDYYFIREAEFKKMIKEHRFVEWAVVHGNNYGTSKSELEKKGARGDLILDIDVQGAQQVKGKFQEALFIFIMPPQFQVLKQRLEARGQESSKSIKKRLEDARKELSFYPSFDYVVINDILETAAAELESIIRCSRLQVGSRREEIEHILRSFEEGV